jgi:hypothetical protein
MTTRESLVREFLELAAEVEVHSAEIADVMRRCLEGKQCPRTWLVRWNRPGRVWDNSPDTPERVIGHALVVSNFTGFFGEQPFPQVIPEFCRLQEVWVRETEPKNKEDLEGAKRARQLGLDVTVQPKYVKPSAEHTATCEDFERVVREARPVWSDDAPHGFVVTGYEDGWDEEGRPCQYPVYDKSRINREPCFAIEGVPAGWLDEWSHIWAISPDGSKRFEAACSNGGGGPINFDDVPDGAEWRIPRQFVERLVAINKDAFEFRAHEDARLRKASEDAERRQLAEKFGVVIN